VLLFLLVIALLHWLSQSYQLRFDWTANAKNSLSAASIAAIRTLDKPVQLTAFVSERQNLRRAMREIFAPYQRYKPDIRLEFVNPDTDPDRTRQAGVRVEGEVILEYAGARENLDRLDEETITNALVRLGHRGERWLVFLDGHGERSPNGAANFDLSQWASELRKRGFDTRTLNLAEHPQIPQNTAVLVIAGPRVILLAAEVELITQYLADGGNLLWLGDPQPLYGLEPLAEMLGIEFQPGVIVDPSSEPITGNATVVVVTRYSKHPTVRDFHNITLFPSATGIRSQAAEGWQSEVLFDTRAVAWSETGVLGGSVELDKVEDIAGPFDLAIALTREHGDRQQRAVIVGDGDFLSNRFLGNGINLDLGMSLVNWVTRDDAYVNIPVQVARDRTLTLTPTARVIIAGGLLFLLPLVFGGSGVFIWARRRRR
jgi:ABC-type uncharacterized transport system involved in gliding motility auxiliary subunit